MWTHGNTHSLLDKPPLQVLPLVGTVAWATQGSDPESECGTALFPSHLEDSCAWVNDSSESLCGLTELLMWPWLLIGPYMNLVMGLCVQVSCPSKGTLIPHETTLVSTIQSSWIVRKKREELLCKHNSVLVINSLSFNSTVHWILVQNKHTDLQTSTEALRYGGKHFATSKLLSPCETEVVSTSKSATLKKNRTILCHYCRVWAVGWWGSPWG